jgi:hypothetical protein
MSLSARAAGFRQGPVGDHHSMAARLTAQRIAESQSRFRASNESIEMSAIDLGVADPIPFICECANRSCFGLVQMSVDRYEDVRAEPRRFFVLPGHELLSVDAGAAIVISQQTDCVVVEEIGVAGEIAERRHGALGVEP